MGIRTEIGSPALYGDAVRGRKFSLTRRRDAWKDALRRRLLAVADMAAGCLALAALVWLMPPIRASALWLLTLVPLWVLLAKAHGLYDRAHIQICYGMADELSAVVRWAVTVSAVTVGAAVLLPVDEPGLGAAFGMFLAAAVSSLLLRAGARSLWRWWVPSEPTLILGGGSLSRAVARRLSLERGHHLGPIGVLSFPRQDVEAELTRLLRERGTERVILALEDLDEQALAAAAEVCGLMAVKLSVTPPLPAAFGTAVHLNHVAELPFIEFRTWDASRSTMLAKRAIDVCVATVVLLLLSPLLAAIAIAILLDSRGPVLFRQARAGLRGEPFVLLKFRTMVPDAEDRLSACLDLNGLGEPVFKLRRDPRVTRLGRLLRRWSLDELPQLVNVLRGEMSLVGPRPEEVWLVERYSPAERVRLNMRPGLTGPMQVHGRADLTFQERLAIEREYVENYSLSKDLAVFLRTAPSVIRGDGAY